MRHAATAATTIAWRMSRDNTLSLTAMRDAVPNRLCMPQEARRSAPSDPNSRRYFRHATWYSRVIVAPSRPGDIAIVIEGRAFMTVAEEMAEFAVGVRVALVRIGRSRDVPSREMRSQVGTGA